MKKYTTIELQNFFLSLETTYNVLVPVDLLEGTRSLGKLSDGCLSLSGGALPMKPTGVFAPYFDLLFTFNTKREPVAPPKEKPSLVVGFTAQDVNCLEFVDRFFSANFQDEHYFSRRKDAVIVAISGACGPNGQMLKIASRNCDIELIASDDHYIVLGYSERGKKILENLIGGIEAKPEELSALLKKSESIDQEDSELLQKASKLILENKVPDEFWQTIADRCINCTACTLVCPTCTCFDVFDRPAICNNEPKMCRWRLRDSCLLSSFMREASGHNPMSKEAMRTRRRVHHKLAADVVRFGHMTCFLCGRCDKVCPSDIGIKSVCKEMIQLFG
jgi:sulfhydrogenase subunit beta (sulfur reductase)